MAQTGSAAFHGGELKTACNSILLSEARQTPPWKVVLPGSYVDLKFKMTPTPQGRLESLPHKSRPSAETAR
jgi:hypothetical protein